MYIYPRNADGIYKRRSSALILPPVEGGESQLSSIFTSKFDILWNAVDVEKMIQVHDTASTNSPANGSSEKDAALALVSDVAQEINPLVEKRVLQKIDMFFMPAMLIGKPHSGPRRRTVVADSMQVMAWYTMTRYDRTMVFLFRTIH